MFEPPVSTPTARTIEAAASRSSWYSSSASVICGATVTESPVWMPIGSRFSIEQTMITLSLRSRMTSSSNSSQPRSDSSTSTCPTGLSRSALSSMRRSSGSEYAVPPPWPPSVKAGRRIDREGQPLGHLVERRDDRRLGHLEPRRADGVAEELAVLRPLDHVQARADQLDAELGEDAGLGQLHRQVERRLAAHRRQERVRPLALEHGGDALRGRAARGRCGRRSRGRS